MAGGKLRGMIRKLRPLGLERDTKHGSIKCKTNWVLYQQNANTSHASVLGLIIICVHYSVKESKNTEESELGEGNDNHDNARMGRDGK